MFDKNDQEISQLIDSSLEAVLSGQATLDQVMAQHPEHAAVLKREIEAAMWLVSRVEQVSPRAGFVPASRKRVIERIKQEAANTGAKHGFFGFLLPRTVAYQWALGVLLLTLVISATSGLVSYSQSSVPGESLYPVKRASEKIQYSFTVGELKRIEVSADFTSRRLQEFVTLVQKGEVDSLEPSLETFEEQVAQTVELLEKSSDAQPIEKKVLANDLQDEFTAQASKLEAIKEQAPEVIKPNVERAKNLTVLSASAAFQEGARIIDPTQTPTRIPTRTITSTSTKAPTRTASPSPTRTRTRTPQPTDTRVFVPSQTPEPPTILQPTDTPAPTFTPQPTFTPVPTNTQVPTFTPVPTNPPTATSTPLPTLPPLPSSTPVPTDTPIPLDTPVPTEEPDPDKTKPPLPDPASTKARPTQSYSYPNPLETESPPSAASTDAQD